MRKYFDVASLVTDPSDAGMLEGVADVVAKAWPMLYAGREGQLAVHHGSIVGFHGSSTRLPAPSWNNHGWTFFWRPIMLCATKVHEHRPRIHRVRRMPVLLQALPCCDSGNDCVPTRSCSVRRLPQTL